MEIYITASYRKLNYVSNNNERRLLKVHRTKFFISLFEKFVSYAIEVVLYLYNV